MTDSGATELSTLEARDDHEQGLIVKCPSCGSDTSSGRPTCMRCGENLLAPPSVPEGPPPEVPGSAWQGGPPRAEDPGSAWQPAATGSTEWLSGPPPDS